MESSNNKDKIKGIVALLVYFAIALFGIDYFIMDIIGLDPYNWGIGPTIVYSLVSQFAILTIIILLFKKLY